MSVKGLKTVLEAAITTCEAIIESTNWHGPKKHFRKMLTELVYCLDILEEYEKEELA